MKEDTFLLKSPSEYTDSNGETATYWTTVGRAFVNKGEDGEVSNIGIKLDALPFSKNLRAWPLEDTGATDSGAK